MRPFCQARDDREKPEILRVLVATEATVWPLKEEGAPVAMPARVQEAEAQVGPRPEALVNGPAARAQAEAQEAGGREHPRVSSRLEAWAAGRPAEAEEVEVERPLGPRQPRLEAAGEEEAEAAGEERPPGLPGREVPGTAPVVEAWG